MSVITCHICPGPSYVTARMADDRSTRWCFRCRAHLPHTWELIEDPPERQPSYYDPTPVCRCSGCNEDHTTFPGIYRDGPNYPSDAIWACLVEAAAIERRTWDWDAIWQRTRAEA